MIVVDGVEIHFNDETREQTVKTIIDAIENGYLSDETIQEIQLRCVIGACKAKMGEDK